MEKIDGWLREKNKQTNTECDFISTHIDSHNKRIVENVWRISKINHITVNKSVYKIHSSFSLIHSFYKWIKVAMHAAPATAYSTYSSAHFLNCFFFFIKITHSIREEMRRKQQKAIEYISRFNSLMCCTFLFFSYSPY